MLGRADDVIVTGGEKVAPAAVERVLAAQPGVRAACVVGLPDAEWGQVVAAAVVWEVPDGATRCSRKPCGSRSGERRAAPASSPWPSSRCAGSASPIGRPSHAS